MAQIIARQSEINILKKLSISGKPEFLAIYGRRRVGKTFLIREFFKTEEIYFHLTGVKDAPARKQLRNFMAEFKEAGHFGIVDNELTMDDLFVYSK